MMEAEIRRAPGFPAKESKTKAYRRTRANQDNKNDTKNEFTFHLLSSRWERGQALSGSSV